jgi:hypothetical protein
MVLLVLVVCYSLTVSVVAHPVLPADASVISENNRQDQFTSHLNNLFCHTSPNDLVDFAANRYPVPETKNKFQGFTQLHSEWVPLKPSVFRQYSVYALDAPVRLRKASMIFPFHNFW